MTKHLIAIAAAAIVLQGCATPAPAPQATEDFNIGIAQACKFTASDFANGTATGTIEMTNDGWCAVRLKEKDGQPFQLGLLKARPQNGAVIIQKMGGETRLEYTANPRFVGADKFTVALRSRTPNAPDVTMAVTVTVMAGSTPVAAPAPAPAPAAPAPARTPAPAKR